MVNCIRISVVLGSIPALLLVAASQLFAQEFEPRRYANVPPGINFIAVGAGYSDGNMLLDPGLPIRGVEGEQNFGFIR